MPKNPMLRMQLTGADVPDMPKPIGPESDKRRQAAKKAAKKAMARMPKKDRARLKEERGVE